MKKSCRLAEAADVDDSCFSPFNCLANDTVLEIFKKLMDLKMLCACQVVSKRFYAIAHQVDAICYTTPFSYKCKSFSSAMTSIQKFVRVKSLCIRCPSINSVLYKWKVKLGRNRIDSFVFVSPTSIYDKKNGLLLYGKEKKDGNAEFPLTMFEDACFHDGILSIVVLKHIVSYLPLLEKVSVTNLDNWGRVSLNGHEKVDELRNSVDVDHFPHRKIRCFVPLLELPVSGYVMKGVNLFLVDWNDVSNDVTYDSFINDEIDNEHDKEEAAYHEAIKEIFKKHRGSFIRAR